MFQRIQFQQNQERQQVKIKCSRQNSVSQLCINPQCNSNEVLLCNQRKCQCRQTHKLCLKGDVQTILELIQEKLQNTSQLKNNIQQTFDNMTNRLSQFKDKLIDQVDDKLKFLSLHKLQRKFYDIFHQNQQYISENKINEKQKNQNNEKLTSQQSSQLWQIIRQKKQNTQNIFKSIQTQMNECFMNILSNIPKYQNFISDQIQRHRVINENNVEKTQKLLVKKITRCSSICKTEQLSRRLIGFFTKKIKSVKLLYKASTHNFSVPKFYQIIGDTEEIPFGPQRDLIVLCLSNKDKIVGGYVPQYRYDGDKCIIDENNQSFRFSLTNNHKFNLKNPKYRVGMIGSKCFQFIGFCASQILIRDNANTVNKNQLHCIHKYIHPDYKDNDKQSYLKFNGNQTYNCALKEWEVYKVYYWE